MYIMILKIMNDYKIYRYNTVIIKMIIIQMINI
jgi:hypothetical protein